MRWFWFSIFCLMAVSGGALSAKKEAQVREIDRQIEQLEEEKRGYEARAIRQENQVERLQFDDKTYLETRRLLQIAEENREKAAAVQEEIDLLKQQREQILNS